MDSRMKMSTVRCSISIAAAAVSAAAAAEWGRAPNGEFWNGHAQRFIHAPSFAFAEVDGAVRYRYDVTDDYHKVSVFRADSPHAGLDGLWDALPVGYVTVVCTAEDADGHPLGESGRRTFWKKSSFAGEGAYPPPARSFALARTMAYDWFLAQPQTRFLAEHGRPDPSYPLNGYPSKMLAAEIRALVTCARTLPKGGEADALVAIARKAADYLIAEAVPEGQPLAHFTRTYAPEGSEYGRFKGEQDTIMLIYPADAGRAFLELHACCGESGAKYLDAASRIADTYIRLQGDDGTWWLKQNAVTGKETNPNRLLPVGVMEFLEEVHRATGREDCRAAADRAFAYIEKGPLADWNWEGQFEDVRPDRERWSNLSKHPACSTAMYLLRRFPGDTERLAQAKALVKFSEDQFVEWTPPYSNGRSHDQSAREDDGTWAFFCKPYSRWMTPCALEQYRCYLPIDASAAKFIDTYLALWRATGEGEYLAKARALGATATRVQESDGFIGTWWVAGAGRNDHRYHTWVNCLLATARALDNLASAEATGFH